MLILLTALALADEGASSTIEPPDRTTMIWQGFDHTWERRALGLWALPHRVSLFRSRPESEHHEVRPDGLHTDAVWQFGQSTGVDGDWMTPQAYVSRVTAPDVHMYRGRAHFNTIDHILGRQSPRALVRFNDALIVPVSNGFESHAVAFVRGIGFRSACLDEPDQCNSDGIWPYRFHAELSPCERVDDNWVCPISVDVGRAWTPGRGGIRGIEQKPLNQQMDIEVDIDWVVLEGAEDALASTTVVFENALDSNRRFAFGEQQLDLPVPGGDRYPNAFVGLSAFGFQFYPTGERKRHRHRGRYVAGWSLQLRGLNYDPTQGVFRVGHAGGIWLPRTVWQTGVAIELGITVAQLGHEDAEVLDVGPVLGQLCANSQGAPFFSRWEQCGSRRSSVQTEHTVPIVVKP